MTLRMAQEYAANLPQDMEKRPVREWKNMIRELGDVNVGAIEQYKEVKERFPLTKEMAEATFTLISSIPSTIISFLT